VIRINLLPYRAQRRQQRCRAFFVLLLSSALMGIFIVTVMACWFVARLDRQEMRNQYIRAENKRLDERIREVVALQQEIATLSLRQQAVESMQADRNQPGYLLDELVRQVPAGVYLHSLQQHEQQVRIKGYAQSNDRISELLRNLEYRSHWLEKPVLIEVRSALLEGYPAGQRVSAFSIHVRMRRTSDVQSDKQADPSSHVS